MEASIEREISQFFKGKGKVGLSTRLERRLQPA
jgi:hypothetical protein